MPFSVLKYSSVNAKARALYGKLLSKEDYDELTAKKSVQEVAVYLKNRTGYCDLLVGINEADVHRGELERLFRTSLYSDFIKFFKYLRGKPGKFLKAAFLRYEIEDLKVLLRVVNTEHDPLSVKDSLVFLKKYSTLDFHRLILSKSTTEFIENLKGSIYFKVLSPFIDKKDRQNLFDMEMALDLHFFLMILKLKDKLLSGGDRKSISHSFGVEIDIQNLQWIYRCKKLFKLSKEITLNHVIPYWYRLAREQLVQLSESRDVEEFKSLVSKTKYARLFKPAEEHLWETNYLNFMYRMYKFHLRTDYFNLGTLMAYLHLKEMDIRNIVTLIEGVRYSLPKEEIKSYLIGNASIR